MNDVSPQMMREHNKCGEYHQLMVDRRQVLGTLRQRLDEVVSRSGRSRSAFAEQAGVDRSTLSQLLSPANSRLPRLETLLAIARDQEVSIDWLVGLSNVGPMQAEMMQEHTAFEPMRRADNDERLMAWLQEAVGYRVRYVPTTIPDLLKTDAVIRYELADFVAASPSQRIETSAARLAWTRAPETEMECCSSVQSLRGFARGEGIWAGLGAEERLAQLDHIAELTRELYPALRWFLFDGLERFAAPVTIFGPLRAALYLGQLYLVLTSTEHVRTLSRHFDDLIRGAVVQPPDIADFVVQLRRQVRT
jgi:transcriptional regulator with XRE-family HTH domain